MAYVKDNDKAGRYSAIKTRLFLMDLILSVFLIVSFQLFLSGPLDKLAGRLAGGFYVSCLFYATVFMAFMYVLSFPLHFYASYKLEHQFELSTQNLGAWTRDEFKGVALSYALYAGCALGFYAILRTTGQAWWAVCATAWIFFTVILARLFPVLIIPLFYEYLPLDDDELKRKVLRLAEKADIDVLDVSRIDLSRKTKKANAALVGFGSTRRVVVSDTLHEAFDHDEVETVIAHEFGHYAGGHIWKLLAGSALVTYAGFFLLHLVSGTLVRTAGASGIDDLYLLPSLILLMSVFGLAVLPAQNYFSRVLERQADAFALAQSGKPGKFISTMDKLAEMNLAEREPSPLKKFFFYDHPPVNERIAFAKNVRDGKVT